MKNYNSNIYKELGLIIILTLSLTMNAQVGIGTDKPEGMLDVQNSNLTGIVFPKANLLASNVAAPVLNPNGGALAAGTVVFNTSNTSTGAKDVYEGIYAWDGEKWAPQFLLEDARTYSQTGTNLRIVTSDPYIDIPGLGAGSSFTAKYTGTYRVKANFNFGAGKILTPSSGDLRMATQEGYFKFTFDGTPHEIYTHAYSLYNQDLPTAHRYTEQFRHDSSLVLYVDLKAGDTYDFQLEIDVFVSNNFENNGESGDGRAHVGVNLPCTVEFTFQKEK